MVKVSRTVKERSTAIRLAKERLSVQLGREPTLSELSTATGLEPEEIAAAETATLTVASIHSESGEEGFTLEAVLGEGGMEDEVVERLALRSAIDALPERERQVIFRGFIRISRRTGPRRCWASARYRCPASSGGRGASAPGTGGGVGPEPCPSFFLEKRKGRGWRPCPLIQRLCPWKRIFSDPISFDSQNKGGALAFWWRPSRPSGGLLFVRAKSRQKQRLRGRKIRGETTASKGRKPRSQDFPPKIPHFLRGSRIGCAASYFRRWDKLTLGATNFRYRSAGGRSTPPGPRYTPAADRSAQPGSQSAAHQQRIQKKWVLEIMFQGHQPLAFTYFLV